jgi:hypothetical protein
MTDDLKEAVEAIEAALANREPVFRASAMMGDYITAADLRLVLSALKAAERPQPVPGREEIARLIASWPAHPGDYGPDNEVIGGHLTPDPGQELGEWPATIDRLADAIIALGAPDLLSRLQSAERDRDALTAERDALREEWMRHTIAMAHEPASEPRGDSSLAPEGAPQLGSAQLSSQPETSHSPLAKHTPGPWMAAAKPSSVVGWPIVAQSGRSICSLTYVQHSKIDPPVPGDRAVNAESRANAYLIAAAPDLLEALKVAAKWITVGEAADAARAQVAAAIARAERNACPVAVDDRTQAASEASEPLPSPPPTRDGADKPVEGEGG